MSKKRKLRHKEWTRKLNEKRGAEFKPFQSKTLGEQVRRADPNVVSQ